MSVRPFLAAGLAGFGGGTLIGLVGWGGAQVINPALSHPFIGAAGPQAAAVSLCSLSFSAVTGGVAYAWDNKADLVVAGAIGAPAVVGARVGVSIATKLSTAASGLIFNGLSVIMIPTHFLVQHYRRERAEANGVQNEPDASHSPAALAGHVLFGGAQGVLSAVMGVGGLPLAMSYLTLTCPHLPHHLVQGTAMASVVARQRS